MFKKTLLTVLLGLGLCVQPVFAKDFPTRPITIVVPFGAGGETDIVTRIIAESMSQTLGQNVAVQNIVGASGVTGMSSVVNAKADGYMLCSAPSAPLAIHPHMRKVPYKVSDMAFLGRIMNTPYYVVARGKSPWKGMADMEKDMKANPDKHFWASAGVGSVPYMAMVRVLDAYNVTGKHVSFSSDADAFQAMAGNRADLYATSGTTLAKFDIKPLAILSAERQSAYSNVPTLKELGHDIQVSQWVAIFAPKGTPASVVKVLENAIEVATKDPKVIAQLEALGVDAAYLNAADTKKFVESESKINAELIKATLANQK